MPTTVRDAQASIVSARPTSSAMSGKCTARLSAMVPEEFALEFQRFALLRGYPSASDCMREILFIAVLGEATITKLHRDRIGEVGRNLTGIGQEA
jgi:hypothetical protein